MVKAENATGKKKLKIGLIGCGYWGPNLIRNYVSLDDVEITGVCDASEDRLDGILRIYPMLQGVNDAEGLVNDEETKALVIASPAVTHYELAKKALLAGKHVFVEKPLSLSVSEGEELVKISEERGLVLMTGHLLLYHPVIDRMKQFIESGELGDVLYIYGQWLNLGKIRHDENCLWSLGPHGISVILYLLEKNPVEVSVNGMDYLQDGLEDVVFCNLRFDDDVVANLHISWLDPHKVRKLTIVGKKKMLVFDDMENTEKLRLYDKGVDIKPKIYSFAESLTLRSGDVLIPAFQMTEPLANECRHFVDCIREGAIPRSNGREGLEVLKILDAAQKSLEMKGAPVPLP
ncbi:MAG: Gfo/Idh/MocA family oxidoreductase [Actinobacteria bacterium]|nr:Gfo/Idh/MocA family oxidoreductase [Actinomycetota bacterium]